MCCDRNNIGSAKSIIRNGGVLEMPEAPQVTQAAQHSAPDDDTPSYQLGGDGCLM